MHFYRLFFFSLILLFQSCSNSGSSSFRIGIDPSWYAEDFGPQTAYVNGYTEDLLLEMSRYSGMQFELVRTSWDDLLDGLRQKEIRRSHHKLAPVTILIWPSTIFLKIFWS